MITVPDWLYDNAPFIAVGAVGFIVLTIIIYVSMDVGSARAYCESLNMLYNPDFHGCVEGVNIP